MNVYIRRALAIAAGARSNRAGIAAMRIAIAIIFLWIGGLKFAPFEADSITPFVANSPAMSFFYKQTEQYKLHTTHEGKLNQVKRDWQTTNPVNDFDRGLGTLEIIIGLLTLSGFGWILPGLVGALFAFFTPFVTLSFLIATREAWVPALGDTQHGFPYLPDGGRLVIKDLALLAGTWLLVADSARRALKSSLKKVEKGEKPQARRGHLSKAVARSVFSFIDRLAQRHVSGQSWF
ncbi:MULTISPECIES: DUF417 family protein [unclassified Rhizobium]